MIYIAGDSTAAHKEDNKRPETGWGEMLGAYLNTDAAVSNRAINGRSSKSFIEEGHLQKIWDTIQAGDVFLIQFGHNDEKDAPERHTDPYGSYQSYLTEYITGAREHGAYPVLLTSIQRRSFDENGKITQTHGDYPQAMKDLAARLNVPLIDLCEISRRYFEELGPEKTKSLFLWLDPGVSPNYPDGVQDNTHFCTQGAREIARLVAGSIRSAGIRPLVELLTEK